MAYEQHLTTSTQDTQPGSGYNKEGLQYCVQRWCLGVPARFDFRAPNLDGVSNDVTTVSTAYVWLRSHPHSKPHCVRKQDVGDKLAASHYRSRCKESLVRCREGALFVLRLNVAWLSPEA